MAGKHIIVVGAGIAGLTAAYRLRQAGHDVTVLESKEHVGGRMITVHWEGYQIDPGAKFVTGGDVYLMEMARELGLSDELYPMYQDGVPVVIWRNGKVYACDFVSIPSYLTWGGVSFGARLAMLKLLPYLWPMRKVKNMYHLEQAPGPDEETLEEFFYKHINPEMFEYWAAPTFEVYCSYGGHDISRKAFLALMMSYLNQKSYGFKRGIGSLPDALAEHVQVIRGARVERVSARPDGSGVTVSYTHDGQKKTLDGERAVLAVPGNYVLPLLDDPRPAWQTFFPKVGYTSTVALFQTVKMHFEPGVVGVMIPRKEKRVINTLGVEHYRDGETLLLMDSSVEGYDPSMPDDEFVRQARVVAAEIFPELEGKFGDYTLFHWSEKVPTYKPGYLDALAEFWRDPQEGPIYFCGDYFAGPSTGGALFSGWECADRVLSAL